MAVRFDTTDSNMAVTTDSYTGITGTGTRSMSCWVKIWDSSTYQTFFAYGATPNGQAWTCSCNTGLGRPIISLRYYYEHYQPSDFTLLNNGDWHHIVYTFNGTTAGDHKFYIDGNESDRYTVRDGIINTQASLIKIGNDFGGGQAGKIELFDVRFYSKELSLSDINDIYDDGNGCDNITDNLELRYEFRKQSGTVGTVLDTSGNNRHGAGTGTIKPIYTQDPFKSCTISKPKVIIN